MEKLKVENDQEKRANKLQKEPPSAEPDASRPSGDGKSKDRGLPMGGSYGDVDAEGGARSGSDLPSQQQ